MYKEKKLSWLLMIISLTFFLLSIVGADVEPLQLTDDETIEMYNCPFPDGSKILFTNRYDDLHWNLYTIPVDGSGEKTNISPGEGTYHYPDIHPTGDYICYSTGADDNDIWKVAILEIGGEEKTLTDGLDSHYPVFNGDGTKIAYVSRNWDTMTDSIMVIDLETTTEYFICQLYTGSTELVNDMDWLGDDEIIFVTVDYELYRVSTITGSIPVRIGTGSEYHTCYSNSDGTEILCGEGEYGKGIFYISQYITIKPDGTDKTIIVDENTFPMFERLCCQLCWLPDESGIINLATTAPEDYDLFKIDTTDFINGINGENE